MILAIGAVLFGTWVAGNIWWEYAESVRRRPWQLKQPLRH